MKTYRVGTRRFTPEAAQKLGEATAANGNLLELYRKWRSGEHFLLVTDPEGKKKVIPLPLATAQRWAKQHLAAEAYREAFDSDVKSKAKVHVTLSISERAVARLKILAAEHDRPMSEVVENLIFKA